MDNQQNQGYQNGAMNMNGPANGQMNMGGQMNGPMMTGQPMGPVKQPMDPAKKRKIILGVSLGVGGVVLLAVGIIVAMMLMKVDYGESYRIAKELKPEVYELAHNTDCANVLNFVDSASTDLTKYDGFVEGCKSLGDGIDDAVKKLGNSAGVKRNNEINTQYKKFQETLETVVPDKTVLEEKLALYQAWHKFEVLKRDLRVANSTDAEIQATAQALIDSGNTVLKEYGEGWLEKSMAYAQAARAYNAASYNDGIEQKTALRKEADQKRNEQSDWVKEHQPKITELVDLKFDSLAKIYDEFDRLYEMITDQYEQNYDSGSGDCSEIFGEVFCD